MKINITTEMYLDKIKINNIYIVNLSRQMFLEISQHSFLLLYDLYRMQNHYNCNILYYITHL